MPKKMVRSAPRPPFGLPELTVAARSTSVLREGRKKASIQASSGVICGIPDKRDKKHPGNPGKTAGGATHV